MMTGEKKVSADQGLPRGTISRTTPTITPASSAADHWRCPCSFGSKGCADSNPRIMLKLRFELACSQLGELSNCKTLSHRHLHRSMAFGFRFFTGLIIFCA